MWAGLVAFWIYKEYQKGFSWIIIVSRPLQQNYVHLIVQVNVSDMQCQLELSISSMSILRTIFKEIF